MDRENFDTWSRRFAATPSRRTALTALLGLAISGTLSHITAQPAHSKRRKRARRRQDAARVQTEAVTCEPPRPSANLRGCDYSGRNLQGAVLRSSTLTDARFVGANLCGANLSSSQLRRADFSNANLTRANLRSSGCAGATFTGATFCRTIDCSGKLRNDSCPGVSDAHVCCSDESCDSGERCCGSRCLDTRSDANNCGSCGRVCGVGATCQAGACVGSCLTRGICCGTSPALCEALCCTGRSVGDGGCAANGFSCFVSELGGQCATDNDCTSNATGGCRGGVCCSARGGPCFDDTDCCTPGATCDPERGVCSA